MKLFLSLYLFLYYNSIVKQLKPYKKMEKNPNSWRLLSIFFAMAMLFALGSVDVKSASIDRSDPVTFVNLPPGQDIIAITVIENVQINNQPEIAYQIARGVSVPYRGLMIVNNNFTFNQYQSLVGDVVCKLADRCSSKTISTLYKETTLATKAKPNQSRGVKTRLTDYKLIIKT